MARKYDFISELYNRTCKTVVATPASWEAFLRSACYNYRLRFDEQLLVHAQRPDATAVLQIDDWNQKFGRWVNRGAHGIAVFEDADQRRQRLVHYFDISDTHPSRFSRRVPIWQMRDEYTAEVIDTLESTFGELNDKETLAVAIESAARNAVEDNIPDYLPDLLYSVKDSFLDGVSEEEITHIFKTAVRNSVAYMTMTRLGIEAGEYFEPDDLRDVVNFTTPATLNALGYATSDIAEMGLAEISRTILALDRQNRIIAEKTKADYNVGKEKTERSPDDERDHLHDAGGLSAPRSDNAGAAGAVDGQVRPDAEEVPEGASQGTLLQPADELRPERASERHGAQSERDGTDADGADGSVGGRDGESESDGYDELGSEDEQYPEPGSGDRDGGGNLRLDYYDRSHEDKSLPFFGGDDTIREILGTTPHLKASKDEIRAFFEATADENARISYIKGIFNNDYTEVILSDGRRVGYKTYQNVLQLWEGSYLSRTAQSFYDWGVIAQHFEAMRLLGELQDTMKPLPSIDGQLSLMTAGAEERKPSAFTFSQEIIDAVLTRGSGISEGKMRIYEQFQKSLSAKENADFLKNEYGWGGSYPVIVGAGIDEQHDGKGIRISKGIGSDKPHIDLKWSQVEKRIAELIKLDRYLNPKEKAQYPEWLQKQEERRAALTEERRNREILSTAPSEKTEPENERYEYHLGSTVYLGANEYEILSFDDERVMLYDTQFPLFNKEMTRAEFDSKVQENPLNDHLKVANKQSEEKAVEFDIGMGYLGNGLTVWNRAVEVNGDYQNIAHISPEGEITFYVQDLPQSVVERIEQAAEREKPKDAALPEFYQAYLKTKADKGCSFVEAVETLMGKAAVMPSVTVKPKQKAEPKVLLLPDKSASTDKITEYLFGRGIDYAIIQCCIDKGLIFESLPYHNLVCVGFDEKNTPRYASYRATNDRRVLGDCSGSDKHYSFRIADSDSGTVHLFECAIDLLSYATLEKMAGRDWRKDNLVSLAGVYLPKERIEDSTTPAALVKYLDEKPQIKKIFLHFDNDNAGRKASLALKTILPSKYEVIDSPPPCGKDYNDFLCFQLGIHRNKTKERTNER